MLGEEWRTYREGITWAKAWTFQGADLSQGWGDCCREHGPRELIRASLWPVLNFHGASSAGASEVIPLGLS